MDYESFLQNISIEKPEDEAKKKELIDALDTKLGILVAGSETIFWKEIVEVIEEKKILLRKEMEKYRKEQITKVPPQEFVTNLLSMEKLLEALEKLQHLPDILAKGYRSSIDNLNKVSQDKNFMGRFKTRLTEGVKL